jgi:predicted Zn-dependent protease with MMP-like domain
MISSAELQNVLLEAIDEGLRIFGVLGRKVIYEALEERAQLRREEIPHKITLFQTALEDILGTGSKPVEKQIAQLLYRKLGVDLTWQPNRTLANYVNELRQLPRGERL